MVNCNNEGYYLLELDLLALVLLTELTRWRAELCNESYILLSNPMTKSDDESRNNYNYSLKHCHQDRTTHNVPRGNQGYSVLSHK